MDRNGTGMDRNGIRMDRNGSFKHNRPSFKFVLLSDIFSRHIPLVIQSKDYFKVGFLCGISASPPISVEYSTVRKGLGPII